LYSAIEIWAGEVANGDSHVHEVDGFSVVQTAI